MGAGAGGGGIILNLIGRQPEERQFPAFLEKSVLLGCTIDLTMLGNAEAGSSGCEGNDTLSSNTKPGSSRVDLLTLDQRHSSKDIFISISGLIGACSEHIT